MATYSDFAPFTENVWNTGMGLITGAINRRLNYKYNEMAAENADRRTRALYNDIYSPKALLGQYAEAGLSPSLMFGGTPGQGGTSGAQGGGAAGQPITYTPMNLMESAQIENIKADTNLKNAQADVQEKEAAVKEIEKYIASLQEQLTSNELYKNGISTNILGWHMPNSKHPSFYQWAGEFNSFDDFLKAVQAEEWGDQNENVIRKNVHTEIGVQTLKDIYFARQQLSHDITILSGESVSSDFQKSIVNALKSVNYANLNANAAASQLEASIATNDLTTDQKNAWNHVIEYIREKGGDKWADALIILSMIISQFAGKVAPTINTGDRNYSITNNK